MKNRIIKTTLFSLAAAALVAFPTLSRAEDQTAVKTNAPAHHMPGPRPLPFHGKAAAIDTAAMTLTVGTNVIVVTSETKIFKDGKPATLSDLKVGEVVGGSYKKDEAGKNNASLIRAGLRTPENRKKAEKTDPAAPATPPTAP